MTKEEIARLLAKVVSNYPSLQNKDTRVMAELWYAILKEVPFDVAEKAILNIIATDEFPPTVARVRKEISKLTTPEPPEFIEAWGEVTEALRHYGSWYEERALNSLSPLTRKVVEAIGWQEICSSENIDVIRGQFRTAYEALQEREKEERLLMFPRAKPQPKLEQSTPQEEQPRALSPEELAEKWRGIDLKKLAEGKKV